MFSACIQPSDPSREFPLYEMQSHRQLPVEKSPQHRDIPEIHLK
jgi:hypothetical protein